MIYDVCYGPVSAIKHYKFMTLSAQYVAISQDQSESVVTHDESQLIVPCVVTSVFILILVL